MVKINPNCWSEHGELKTVMVCSPSSNDIPDQRTADYVGWEKPVNQDKAKENHEKMVKAMEDAGVTVIDYSHHLNDEDAELNHQLINRVFVRDLACVCGNTVIPGDAGITMRAPEYIHSHGLFQTWFNEKTFSIGDNNRLKALENGDVFVLNKDSVFINTGMRTSIESIEEIQQKIFQAGFSEIGIIDLPRTGETMHLDMNCNVAGSELIIAKSYMRLFPVQIITEKGGRYVMMEEFIRRQGFDVLWTDDVKHTVADINFLNLDPETMLVSTKANKKILKGHPKLQGKNLIEVEVNELEKGGGGIRCMTLPLERI
ncbi:arginine deiminase [Bacillus sp. BHET2]|uniref:arginine deiminase family protein n=1 Tax=Bacillus sp. BHET2 TaxID=2583818 RepID=UPI00110E6949|nr:arginine deiminase family protein [Bacillus sp. BHET2]TMU84430.1 arginine deiminase [Bacillus sp. BHET2]